MLNSKTRWVVSKLTDEEEKSAALIAGELSLSPLTARLLLQRGITGVEAAKRFLYGELELLHDPYKLKGLEQGVHRIRQALAGGEAIRIYGDYDADGVSSTSLMIRLLRSLGSTFDYYIPHRQLEGYGLNNAAVEAAAAAGVKLLITVDTGISAVEQIAYAGKLGIDVVVTDHHEPPAVLPEAAAIINPKQKDCPYPFKGLAGVGVAFKLATALLGRTPLEWTDLVALGTIADLMPLVDENRVLVKKGLEQLRHTAEPGFRALAEVSGIHLDNLSSEGIAFGMAPRINAAGRLAHADIAVRLLASAEPAEAELHADSLDALNRERQQIVDTMVKEAEALWSDKCRAAAGQGKPEPGVIVVAAEGWNVGVVGIVASKLIERHYRPTLVLGIDRETGKAKGSARSIDGYDLHAALTECAALLEHYGGHQAAAGMTLHRDRLDELELMLDKLAGEWLQEEDLIRKTAVDLVCGADEADLDTVRQLQLLEPFGAGNPQPKLLVTASRLKEKRAIGKEGKHLRLTAARGRGALEAVGFGLGELAKRITEEASVEMLGELSVNEWNGIEKPQLLIRDLRIPHRQFFDGRGEKDPLTVIRQLQALYASPGALQQRPTGNRQPGAEEACILILTHDPSFKEAAAGMEAVRADGWDTGGAKHSVTLHYDQLSGLEMDCTVLVLLDKPPCGESLSAFIQRSASLEAVHALYKPDRRAPRFPERSHFAEIYQAVRKLSPGELIYDRVHLALAWTGWPEAAIRMMIDVFIELGFILSEEGNLKIVTKPERRDLAESRLYKRAEQAAVYERLWLGPAAELGQWLRGL
ncbi:single-stranded-DNA-specific exonuclease RecJ [Paenibacillus sambharensis]|uniref:Single-stranded-DNA-specific exonuclease RecJ n=1 Tax=Paenibacillus sambharensis TaxID=1803190 RepID=A0A2W1LGT5_9BACL|nr:single-stranded-DNA-specific exonuclease RecJ [Paenibacillus sambharensis]PZD94235.1 single-stranded-DNA-specific exonuclease RecJ [Paenibacillus sambharensis]